MSATLRHYKLFINGDWAEPASGKYIEVINPATGDVVASAPDASSEDVDAAVKAARQAFESGWAFESQQRRGEILRKMADIIRERQEELAAIEVSETGRPLGEISAVDIPETADCFDYYAGAARLLKGETIPLRGSYLDYTLCEPVGVVAQLVPWNFPLNLASWKIAPALAAGNCVVLKPSELTPSSAMELARIAVDAGLPPGVLNVINGYGSITGQALVTHVDVDMVAFTGGVTTGRQVAELAGRNGKRVSLELGGKSAHIVFPDCDLEAATASVLEGGFFAQGENCCAGSRVLVHDAVSQELIGRLKEHAARLRIGPPSDPETQIGCLISENHFSRVMSFIDEAKQQGGVVATGGKRAVGARVSGRPFLEPTIILDPPVQSRVFLEEVFGPVMVINSFEEEEKAIRIANATQYDLAAGIWTSDLARAHRVARRLRAGSVWINTYNRIFNDAPFGGHRWSGFGRDLGFQAILQYTSVKNVCVSYEPGFDKWF